MGLKIAEIVHQDVFKPITNIYQSLERSSEFFENKIALSDLHSEITYQEFKIKVDSFAAGLLTKGVTIGTRVAFLLTNSIEFCIAFYALAKLGAIIIPISTKFKSSELLFPLQNSDAEILICEDQWWDNIKPIITDSKIHLTIFVNTLPHPADNAHCSYNSILRNTETTMPPCVEGDTELLIMYTSGTTGVPKGAILTHRNILCATEIYRTCFSLTDRDSTIISIPIFHITGLSALLVPFIHVGGTIYMTPYFSAKQTLEIIERFELTFLHASPTIYILLLNEMGGRNSLKSIRISAAGSANMPVEILYKFKKLFPSFDFRSVYGLTETSSPTTIMDKNIFETGRLTSCGKPVPGISLRILDDLGNTCKLEEIGEICIKGSTIMKSYLLNAYTKTSGLDDGWFKTGDLGYLDNDGYLYVVDRKKDMINHGGEKIYSIEVENALYKHPLIEEVAVIGQDDEVYGEVVTAVIKTQQECISVEDLHIFCKERLASYKIPKEFIFVKSLPHTESGKINKQQIKEMISGGLNG